MPVRQPSLWDNVALETGFRCLVALKLDEAASQFNEALKSATGNRESIYAGLAACQYWQTRIQQLEELATPPGNTESRSGYMTELLEDYTSYPFTPMIRKFKKALLNYFAGQINQTTDMNNLETAFDLLLAVNEYQKAATFVSEFIMEYPEMYWLLYLLAQAQWLHGNKTEALGNYARALLYYPDTSLENRIESGPLKNLIHLCGLSMAPAFGWARNILPLVVFTDIVKPADKQHEHAIKSYQLMQQAEESLKNNDKASSIHFRKQLKEFAPDLYEAYFNLLKQRK